VTASPSSPEARNQKRGKRDEGNGWWSGCGDWAADSSPGIEHPGSVRLRRENNPIRQTGVLSNIHLSLRRSVQGRLTAPAPALTCIRLLSMDDLANIVAIFLAGGRTTRLRSVVSDRPKVLADVAGRPFLADLLDLLDGAGVRRTVLSVGYMEETVRQVIGTRFGSMEIAYSREDSRVVLAGRMVLRRSEAVNVPPLSPGFSHGVRGPRSILMLIFPRSVAEKPAIKIQRPRRSLRTRGLRRGYPQRGRTETT
jgi:MobA-like NTP transferase domain